MLRNSLIGFILLAWSSTVLGQQAKLHIQAIPDNSVVLFDGDTLGSANDRTVYLGFNERKGIDTHTVIVTAPDHVPFERTYTLDMPKDIAINVRLPRVLPTVSEPINARVDWRQVISGIPYGTELGAGTRWLYRFRKDVLDVQAKDELHEALSAMNLNLFDSLPNARQRIEGGDSARLMLQGLVESYTLRRGLRSENYASYYKAYTASVSVRWQLVDRENGDSLLLDQPFASVYEYRGIATIGFHDAVVDNFYRFAQSDTSLMAAFESLDKPRPIQEIGRFEEAEGDSGTVLDSTGTVIEAPLTTMDSTEDTSADSVGRSDHNPNDTVKASQDRQAYPSSIEKAEVPIEEETPASMPTKKGPKRIIPMPRIDRNERYASAGLIALLNDGSEIDEVGVILAKGGLAVVPKRLAIGQRVRLRFGNGVELDASVEALADDMDLSLVKIDANNLKAVLASSNRISDDELYTMPRFDEVNKVGVSWDKLLGSRVDAQSNIPLPVFSANYEWLGFQWPSSRFLDAQTVLNVFGISYE